jgi:hypothetical protein
VELSSVFVGFTKTVIVRCCVSGMRLVENLRTSHTPMCLEIGATMLSQ